MATATLAEAPVSFGSAHQIDYKWVPIGETFRPEGLQRPMDESHVERIVANFNDAAFGTPIISYRDPGNRGPRGQAYAIVAGQHRIESEPCGALSCCAFTTA